MSSVKGVSLMLRVELKRFSTCSEQTSKTCSKEPSQLVVGFQNVTQASPEFDSQEGFSSFPALLFPFKRDEASASINFELHERNTSKYSNKNSPVASALLELSCLKIPFEDWIPLGNRKGKTVHSVLVKFSYFIKKDQEMIISDDEDEKNKKKALNNNNNNIGPGVENIQNSNKNIDNIRN